MYAINISNTKAKRNLTFNKKMNEIQFINLKLMLITIIVILLLVSNIILSNKIKSLKNPETFGNNNINSSIYKGNDKKWN